MKEPTAARVNKTAAPREAAAPARRAVETTELRVVARYYRRMKPQRVYDLVVELQGAGTSAASPVFVNPVIPGALVTPAEQTLDPMVAGSKATFHVTPLARGTLRGARLDVFQEIRLGIRCVTQRLTWVLAALTVLVPAFLLYFTAGEPMVRVVKKFHEVPKAQAGKPGVEQLKNPPKELTGPLKEGEEEELQEDEQLAQKGQEPPKGDPQPKPKQSGRGRGSAPPPGDAADPAQPQAELVIIQQNLFLGDALAWEIEQHMPSSVRMPWQGDDDPPLELPTKHLAWGVGQVYTHAHELKKDHLSFWVGLTFLVLTVISAIAHRAAGKRQRGRPLLLAGGSLVTPHAAGAQ